jgi:hypothetical protein
MIFKRKIKPMIKYLIFTILVLGPISIQSIELNDTINYSTYKIEESLDSSRIDELNSYWTELSRTVKEGDFEGYKAAYKENAVVVFASGTNKFSQPIFQALSGWKQGFHDTKEGKVSCDVTFRFSQRIGDESTAHETGIFHYTSVDGSGKTLADQLVHFEMLLIKEDNKWYGLMEYQKSIVTQKEWDALK